MIVLVLRTVVDIFSLVLKEEKGERRERDY